MRAVLEQWHTVGGVFCWYAVTEAAYKRLRAAQVSQWATAVLPIIDLGDESVLLMSYETVWQGMPLCTDK